MIDTKIGRNRLHNVMNEYQGKALRVLCVCSAGILRSPTIARVLCRDYENINPRAVGTSSEYALIPLDAALLEWTQLIICANHDHDEFVKMSLNYAGIERPQACLGIPDDFEFGDPTLEKMIRNRIESLGLFSSEPKAMK